MRIFNKKRDERDAESLKSVVNDMSATIKSLIEKLKNETVKADDILNINLIGSLIEIYINHRMSMPSICISMYSLFVDLTKFIRAYVISSESTGVEFNSIDNDNETRNMFLTRRCIVVALMKLYEAISYDVKRVEHNIDVIDDYYRLIKPHKNDKNGNRLHFEFTVTFMNINNNMKENKDESQ